MKIASKEQLRAATWFYTGYLVDFKKKSDIHWARKMWHMGGVLSLAFCYSQVSQATAVIGLAIVWLLFVPADFIRQKNEAVNSILVRYFRPLMREHEFKRLSGTTYLLTGVMIVVMLFPRDIVLLTMLYLALADPLASLIGIKFGKDKLFGHKSLQGTVAAFVVCALLTFFYLRAHGILLDRIMVVTLLGGLIGCLAELIPIANIDDNFTLPLVSATSLYALFYFFDAFSALGPIGVSSL